MAKNRIIEEFKAMRKDENNQYTIELVHDSFLELRAEIPGPLGTPYEGGKFSLILDVPESYPSYPPKVRFETNVWHPNILPNSGHICIDILYDNWETDMTLRFVLLAIQFLMTEGNPNDCYNPEAGGQLLNDQNVFHITAKHWTNVYAGGPYEVLECDQKIKFLADQNIDEDLARCILSDENWDVEAALVHYRLYYLEDPTNNLINSMVTSDTHNEELALDTNGVVAAINSTTGENGKQANQRLYEPRERFVITKNVVVIGLAFMIHFTAFHGTSNLQSSVNADKALGTTTLAVIYGSLILSNIFLPMTVISWFGCRLTMALALFAYMPYIAAQFYPRFETLIPAALMVGFGGGPLWCSKCTYLSTVSEALTQVRGNNSRKDVNTVKFFGLFFIFYQMAQVWGNLISSSVLTLSATTTPVNESIEVEPLEASISRVGELCGARFCPGIGAEVNPNLVPPAPEQIQLLNSIFLTCMAGAVVMMIFGVSSLKRYGVKRGDTGDGMSGLKLLTVTINLLRKRRQILMLPITMFIGLEEAFLAVDFTRSFVACGWGISKIGFAMICFGVANAIAAGIAGALVERIGRVTLAAICAVINICLLAYMYSWEAREGDYLSYCTFAAIWGICDGVWLVVVNAFYGILFPNHLIAAYSNFRLWESTGSVIGYIISSQLCTSTKLVILMGVMLIGCVGYGLIEYRVWQKQKNLEAMLSD